MAVQQIPLGNAYLAEKACGQHLSFPLECLTSRTFFITDLMPILNYTTKIEASKTVGEIQQLLAKTGAKKMVKDKVPDKFLSNDQARRVAWRILKTWVEAQIAIIEAQLASLAEIMLPYAITKNGNTLFKEIEAGNNSFLLN